MHHEHSTRAIPTTLTDLLADRTPAQQQDVLRRADQTLLGGRTYTGPLSIHQIDYLIENSRYPMPRISV